jgi:thioredoxin-related protein
MAARPVVDGVEREHGARLEVVRLNVQDPASREAAARYGFRFTPTFIFFDELGREQWRSVGSLDPQQVRDSLGRP